MRLSIRWLKQFLHVELTVEQLVETLTMAGLEVEEELDLGMKSGKVVVAKVLEVRKHPNADKLSVCKVDAGLEGGPLTVVCGAPNVEAGMIAPLALEGATLANGEVLKRSKIRGQESQGMLCAADELGLGNDHTGIIALPDTFAVGTPFDYLVEIKVTPNRPDCLSVLGVARDVGAMLGKKVFPPTPRFKEMLDHIESYVRLSIKARFECPRYTCRLIRGVRIGESPVWLKRALEASGLRPINNIVDVTNYVLMELGHPLHAFDFEKLENGEIQVRLAAEGEPIRLIDGRELALTAQDLVIADARRPVALAGVMGGMDTEVTPRTVHILLESAYFDPGTIRKTARRYGLQTDASYRFERGADRQRVTLALGRATQLIQEIAGGEVAKGMLDIQATIADAGPIVLELRRVNALLGLTLSGTEIADYLVNLGFEIRRSEKDNLLVAIPSWRVDITRDVDLIEEIARLHNYNNIPSTMPRMVAGVREKPALEFAVERARDALAGCGFAEATTFSFIGEAEAARFGFDPRRLPRLANPLSSDQAVMRPTLLAGLLAAAAGNQKVDENDIRLFEVGKVWNAESEAGKAESEGHELALVVAGPTAPGWTAPVRQRDFYDLKGAVEGVLAQWSPGAMMLEPLTDSPRLHPGRAARIQWRGQAIGELGELHPDLAEALDLRGRVTIARIDLRQAAPVITRSAPKFQPIPRFPGSWRDLAVVVDAATPAGEVEEEVRRAAKGVLEDYALFDVYEGEKIPAGKKSLALRVRLRSAEKTLTDEEINGVMATVAGRLEKRFAATLRA